MLTQSTAQHIAASVALNTATPVLLTTPPPTGTNVRLARKWLVLYNPNAAAVRLGGLKTDGTPPGAGECLFTVPAGVTTAPFWAASGLYALATAAGQTVELLEGY